MSTLTSDEFGKLFRTFRKSAFRLETLQHYDAPSDRDAFAAFQATGEVIPNRPWMDTVQAATEAGKTMQRIRVVTQPHTPYTEFELASYRFSASAGEDISIVTDDTGLLGRVGDFWLFDHHTAAARVALMSYDQTGRFQGARLLDAPTAVTAYADIRETLTPISVPLADYLTVAGV